MRPHRAVEAVGDRDRQRAPHLHELVGGRRRSAGRRRRSGRRCRGRAARMSRRRASRSQCARRRPFAPGDRLGEEADDRARAGRRAAPAGTISGRKTTTACGAKASSAARISVGVAAGAELDERGLARAAGRSSSAQARKYVDWPTNARRRRPPAGGVGYGASARLELPNRGHRLRCRAMSDWEDRVTRETSPAAASRPSCATRSSPPLVREAPLWVDLGCGTGVAAADGWRSSAPRRALLVDAPPTRSRRPHASSPR